MSLITDGLIMLENALFNDRKLGGLHAIIVVTRCREPAFVGAVAPDIDEAASDALLAHLIDGEKACAREVRLVTQRAVQFRGMPDTLMDRQPQVIRQKDDV